MECGRPWPAERTRPVRLDPNQQMGDALYVAVQRLSPQNDTQRDLKTQATNLMVQLAELRALLQAQAIPSLSKPLLIALVLWLVVIFFGFSLLAPAKATSTLALIAGRALGCLRSFHNLGTELSICRRDSNSQRTNDKRPEPPW
jgi:hypothetical protein